MGTPIEEPKLGYGRDIEFPLLDPSVPLFKVTALAAAIGVAFSIGGAVMMPSAGGYVVFAMALVLFAFAAFVAVLAGKNRGRDDVVLRMDRAVISVPRVAIAGPRAIELPLTDLLSDETWATSASGKLVLRTRTADAVLHQSQLLGGTSLDEIRRRVVVRARLTQRQAGRVSRAGLVGAEALEFLGADTYGVVVKRSDDRPVPLATVASAAELLDHLADWPESAVLVTREAEHDALLAQGVDPARLA